MAKKNTASLASSILIVGFLTMAGSAAALQEATSDLLLPYFEVDLTGAGPTTYFSVVNASARAVEVEMTVYTNWGIAILGANVRLAGNEARTVDLRDWLVRGELPDRTLDAAQTKELQAALTGQRAPKSDLYYSTEIAVQRAVGYLMVRAADGSRTLFGDSFLVDALRDLAQGEVLLDVAPGAERQGFCKRHGLRFLNGGLGDTQVVIWTGASAHPPSSSPYYPEARKLAAEATAYAQSGEPLERLPYGLLPLQVVRLSELGLASAAGWIDLATETEAYVTVRYTAQNRYSVGLQTFCLPSAPPETATLSVDRACEASLAIEQLVNGVDADAPPGPAIPVGSSVLWTYLVENTGAAEIGEITVANDQGAAVACPKDVLAPAERMTCNAASTAVEGLVRSRAVVTGTALDADRGEHPVRAEDQSHYFGEARRCLGDDDHACRPGITLELRTNGVDADLPGDAPAVPVGGAVIWLYEVTNFGNVELSNVTVTNDQGVAVDCPETTLMPFQQIVCVARGIAAPGLYSTTGLVTATGTDESFGQVTVEARDPSHYQGR